VGGGEEVKERRGGRRKWGGMREGESVGGELKLKSSRQIFQDVTMEGCKRKKKPTKGDGG